RAVGWNSSCRRWAGRSTRSAPRPAMWRSAGRWWTSRPSWKRSASWSRMWNDDGDDSAGPDRPVRPGRVVVISGPAGSGKTTLVRRLLGRPDLRLTVSISATTRAPRAGEEHGRDYFFVTPEEFEEIRGELLESAEVHGHHYGTPAVPVRRAIV